MRRTKTHWDFVKEEMIWTANDFHEERKWKKAAAKRLCLHIKAYVRDASFRFCCQTVFGLT